MPSVEPTSSPTRDAGPSLCCHKTLIPKSVTRSQALGSSALRNDMVLPEQAQEIRHRFLRMLSGGMT